MGHDCIVVAPSLIPVKAGARVKTGRCDAVMLAKLHRAGELTAVRVPDAAHEAVWDPICARATAVRGFGKAQQHLQGFLLRHGRILSRKGELDVGVSAAYRRWLTTLGFQHPIQQIVFHDHVDAVSVAQALIDRLTGQIEGLVSTWGLALVVETVQAMRGVAFIVAVTVVTEVGDFHHFDNPRQLMTYPGLTPSEHSSGSTVRRGGIAKAGSSLARRALIEGAWSCRMQARVGRKMFDRRDIAWKGQLRLCRRHRHLIAAGKLKVVVTTAIAREMLGFIWAIAREVSVAPARI